MRTRRRARRRSEPRHRDLARPPGRRRVRFWWSDSARRAASSSAISVTRARPGPSSTSACTGPLGSTSTEKRARQPGSDVAPPGPRPSRLISNWAIPVPVGVAIGISNIQRAPSPMRSTEAAWESWTRARAPSASCCRVCAPGSRSERPDRGSAATAAGQRSARRRPAARVDPPWPGAARASAPTARPRAAGRASRSAGRARSTAAAAAPSGPAGRSRGLDPGPARRSRARLRGTRRSSGRPSAAAPGHVTSASIGVWAARIWAAMARAAGGIAGAPRATARSASRGARLFLARRRFADHRGQGRRLRRAPVQRPGEFGDLGQDLRGDGRDAGGRLRGARRARDREPAHRRDGGSGPYRREVSGGDHGGIPPCVA